MTQSLLQEPVQSYEDSNGKPLNGGQLFTYDAGTLTPRATYQDAVGAIPNTNPIVLNERGEAVVYGTGNYRMILKNAAGATIWDRDNIDTGGYAGTDLGTLFLSQVNHVVNSIASLRLVDKSKYTRAFVTGYYAPSDGGGGNYWYDSSDTTSTDNGGTIVVAADGGRWKLIATSGPTLKQFGAKGDGTTDDTATIQAAATAILNTGGTIGPCKGNFVCGAVTIDARNGGAFLGYEGETFFLPNANSVTIFTVSNMSLASPTAKPFTFDGINFDGNGKTGATGIASVDFQLLTYRNAVTKNIDYVMQASASSGGNNAFNLNICDITQYGRGSFTVTGNGTKRCFDVHISNITQFTNGGDTWAAPWFKFTRVITALLENVHCQSLSGTAIGVQIVGQCEGIFINNAVIVWPASGIVADASNGDVVLPSWLYFSNIGVDQPAVHGMDMSCNYLRMANANITGGATRSNTGSGLLMRANCIDYSVSGLQIQGMNHDGLTVLPGAAQGFFFGCNFNGNNVSATGGQADIDIVALTPRDPRFVACRMVTQNTTGSMVINGGQTSGFINSQRLQAATPADTASHALATYTVPANTLVDGKTLRIRASGVFGANANTKTITVNVGGIQVALVTGTYNGVAWNIEAEVWRVDANNVWLVSKTFAGTAVNCTSALQTPFNSATSFIANLLGQNGSAVANDIVMHHFDVELVD